MIPCQFSAIDSSWVTDPGQGVCACQLFWVILPWTGPRPCTMGRWVQQLFAFEWLPKGGRMVSAFWLASTIISTSFIVLQTKSSCVSLVGLRTLLWSPLTGDALAVAESLHLRCQLEWQPGVKVGEGEQGASRGRVKGSSPDSRSVSSCWRGSAHAVAATRVSASLQRFGFLLSLIWCDTMKALGLRRRLA